MLQHRVLRCPIGGLTWQIPWEVTFETIHVIYALFTDETLQILGEIGRTGVAGARYDQATLRRLRVICPPGWAKPILDGSITNRMGTLAGQLMNLPGVPLELRASHTIYLGRGDAKLGPKGAMCYPLIECANQHYWGLNMEGKIFVCDEDGLLRRRLAVVGAANYTMSVLAAKVWDDGGDGNNERVVPGMGHNNHHCTNSWVPGLPGNNLSPNRTMLGYVPRGARWGGALPAAASPNANGAGEAYTPPSDPQGVEGGEGSCTPTNSHGRGEQWILVQW